MEHQSNDSVMIDYETLDVKNSARVISCGLLAFDSYGHPDSIFNPETGALLAPHSTHLIDFSDETQGNRTISQATLAWWNALPEHVRRRVFDTNLPRKTLMEHLQIVVEFLKFHRPKYVWAHSPRFDLNILEDIWEALRDAGEVDFFIDFRKEMDTRTLEAFFYGSSKGRTSPSGPFYYGNAHAEIDDCVRQAMLVQCSRAYLQSAIEILGNPLDFARSWRNKEEIVIN